MDGGNGNILLYASNIIHDVHDLLKGRLSGKLKMHVVNLEAPHTKIKIKKG